MQQTSSPMQLSCLHDFELMKTGSNSIVSMAHIQAPCRADNEKRAPISISAVIDVSGSMAGDKIALVRQCLEFVVGELTPTDRLGIVAFDDNVEERLPLTSIDAHGKDRALSAIRGLVERGSTNLSGGLFAGMDQAQGKPMEDYNANPRPLNQMNQVAPPLRTKKASVKPSSSNSLMSKITSILSSGPAPVTKPPVVVALPSTINFEASHLYSPFKRDGVTMHKYTIQIAITEGAVSAIQSITVLPSRGAPAIVAASAKAKTELTLDAVIPECKVSISFRSDLKMDNVELDWSLGTAAEGKTSKVVTVAKPTAAVAVPAKGAYLSYVWLFTDGQANAGITDPTALVAETRKRLEGSGITGIYTFGFGADHNSNLLQAIAESSQGSYFFIRTTELIKEVFANCLGGLLSIVAHSIVLRFTPAAGTTLKKVLSTLPSETTPDSTVVIKMKDLYSEEQRDLLVELNVNATTLGKLTMGTWTLQWQDSNNEPHTASVPSVVEAVEFLPPGLLCNTTVDEQRNRVLATMALDEAKKFANDGDVVKAKQVMDLCMDQIHASPSAMCPASAAVAEDIMRAKDNMRDRVSWEREGAKVVGQMQNMHAMQRSNALECCDAYETKSKKSMKSKISSLF